MLRGTSEQRELVTLFSYGNLLHLLQNNTPPFQISQSKHALTNSQSNLFLHPKEKASSLQLSQAVI